MLEFKKNQSAFPPPKRIGKGEKFPSGWFGDLWNWIRSSRPIPDNVTIFGMPTANGIILSAKQAGGGAGGGATSDYSGYFTVISSGTGKVKVVNGADTESLIAGYVKLGNDRIPVAVCEFTISAAGYIWIYTKNTDGTVAAEFKNGASIPTEIRGEDIKEIASYSSNASFVQIWQYGEYVITGKAG